MNRERHLGVLVAIVLALPGGALAEEDYLSWNAERATAIGKRMRVKGRAGSWLFDTRGLHTERSSNYKLRATWLTPEVIRASARLLQLHNRYTRKETEALVAEAEAVANTVVLVEIDPDEGSGVIPRDWLAILQPRGLDPEQSGAVRGVSSSKLRKVKALAGVVKRDYDYDRFWVTFPLLDEEGAAVFGDAVKEAELLVRIRGKGARVNWPIPESIRARARQLQADRSSGEESDQRP